MSTLGAICSLGFVASLYTRLANVAEEADARFAKVARQSKVSKRARIMAMRSRRAFETVFHNIQ